MRGIPEWFEQAACKGNTDAMYVDKTVDQLVSCLSYCENCPVKTECLSFYLVYPDHHCVAGGMTPDMRIRFTGLDRRSGRNKPWIYNTVKVTEWLERNFVWEQHFTRVRAILRRKGYRGDI